MSEINFWSHFWPFQINTQLKFFLKFYFCDFFYKMAAGGHFGCPKITLDHISGHFRSIQICCQWPFWRKSLSISFLAISDRYATFLFFIFFYKMAAVGHIGCPKFTLDHISDHFRSIQIFIFFYKMDPRDHFGYPNFTFDHISEPWEAMRSISLWGITSLDNLQYLTWMLHLQWLIDHLCSFKSKLSQAIYIINHLMYNYMLNLRQSWSHSFTPNLILSYKETGPYRQVRICTVPKWDIYRALYVLV